MILESSVKYGKTLKEYGDSSYRELRDKYDNLLEQPLNLGMFVPCDLDGNVLEKPDMNVVFKNKAEFDMHNALLKKFKKAQERVLFKGFEYQKKILTSTFIFKLNNSESFSLVLDSIKSIEDLVSLFNEDLELTPNAIKQLQ